MRLLQQLQDGGDFSLVERFGENVPPYAILSHTWGPDNEEVTFSDLIKKEGKGKKGYRKLKFCSKQAKKDGLKFFWMDTCCIDKSSSAELTEAINSMFKWYQRADICYVFLSDVSITNTVTSHPGTTVPDAKGLRRWITKLKKREDRSPEVSQQIRTQPFQTSRWFKRGWTLQELLAPRIVEFFSDEGVKIGDRVSLLRDIQDTTGISIQALRGRPMSQFSVDERMSWAEGRETKREEDAAYSLLGMFDIHMPLIYGEGRKKALLRLRKEIGGPLKDGVTPSSTIPFRRDDDFVNRESLKRIQKLCGRLAGRAALIGLGGVGKSQIAIEYTYQVREESPTTWAFWLHAGTRARFEEGCRKIAEITKLDGRNEPGADIKKLVRSWLSDPSNGQWIMVVDNADDLDVIFPSPDETQVEPLSDFLPQSSNGSILFTSRNRDVAFRLVGDYTSIIEVKPMEESDAIVLLKKKLTVGANGSDAAQLVQALDYMPLAITQAAAFINQRTPLMTVSRYLNALRSSDKTRAELLNEDLGDIRRDGRASNTIISTWKISFEHIRSERSSAARLLSLMSFFDRQGIPGRLLHKWYVQGDGTVADVQPEFEDDIHTLANYSLVRSSADGNEFEMHRLVQYSMKKWLELSNELEKWKETYVAMMNSNYPIGKYENWSVCGPLFPHAQAAVECRPSNKNAQLAWASLLHKAALYAREKGQYNLAIRMGMAALEPRKEILGLEHVDTLKSMDDTAVTLRYQGDYAVAKEMHKRALEGYEKQLGKEHEDTLVCATNLAAVLMELCEYETAELMSWRILNGYKKTKRENGGQFIRCSHNLATLLQDRGRYASAEQLHRQTLQKGEEVLGKDHPDTLSSLAHLAEVLRAQKKYEDAEPLARHALDRTEKLLGREHPNTLLVVMILAGVLRDQGRYKAAKPLALRALDGYKNTLGDAHYDTLHSLHELAILYHRQCQYEDALPLYVKARTGFGQIVGQGHFELVDCSNNLSLLLRQMEPNRRLPRR